MKITETPYKLIDLWSEMMPDCYGTLDSLAKAKTDGEIWWPDYCLLPINAAMTYLCNTDIKRHEAAMLASELTACWMWRKHRVVYAFDDELAETLAEQAKSADDLDILPSQILLHPPYPIIYVKAQTVLEAMDGFFFWIDYDVNQEAAELRLQWVFNDLTHSLADVLHLLPGKSLRECINDTNTTIWRNFKDLLTGHKTPPQTSAETILRALQLVLYIFAENSEVVPDANNIRVATKRKKGKSTAPDLQITSGIESYQVGLKIGSALRKARAAYESSEGDGAKRCPHARRGHWHHYWTGPLDGDRKLVLKWTAPTLIHADEMENAGGDVIILPVDQRKDNK